jgi:putative SOS response-associated peptidase YedK
MCGRFVSATPPDEIAKYFGVEETSETILEPNYNVAPTTDIYTVLETGGVRRLEPIHWGLVPWWAKDIKVGNRMINARVETIAEKNAFKRAFQKRRCIIPVDGFYEWHKVPGQKAKQPYFIQRSDGEPFAFAGLWEVWRGADREGPAFPSATILTGPANEKMSAIHDRMPIVLPPDAWATWLDPEFDDLDALGRFLVPAPSELITLHPVSTEVNNVRNGGPHLIDEFVADGDGT